VREKLINGFKWVLGHSSASGNKQQENVNNVVIRLKQLKLLLAGIITAGLIIGSTSLYIKGKSANKKRKVEAEKPTLTVELADKNLDPEKHWRNYFEEQQAQMAKNFEKRMQELSEAQLEMINKTNERIEQELATTKEKLAMAQKELTSSRLNLEKATKKEPINHGANVYLEAELGEQDFESEVELDRPKSAKNYIPEGTYFTGHLLGGIAVSTGLNTPDENATPVAIKLMARFDSKGKQTTNLSSLNDLDLQNCRIMGSSYGDLSSERAIVRLEKMVCEQDGVYITSKIAGQIFGPDGLNGVKGTVVSTSSKHIKNAVIGGLISGISSAAKGQEGATFSGAGLIQTKKKGAKNLLGEGALQGTSNAGEKIADYYLRQAEAMSPILTVPSGVSINAQITKGFFVGEVSTHRKIKADRGNNSNSANQSNSSDIRPETKSEYME
jgi:conjugal transfer pilus assembly protein TraB